MPNLQGGYFNIMAYLVLVRHGQSRWNAKGLWTGFTDIPLSDIGRQEAHRTAKTISDIKFDLGFTSKLIRAKETLQIILKDLNLENISIEEDFALNERDYGDYTGKNKWQVKEMLGEEEFNKLRRGWDYPVPNGESLKMVYQRVIPYYDNHILPQLKSGKNILVAASGNSLRALVKYLENIPEDKIAELEITTGEADIYQISREGKIISKQIRAKNPKKI